MAYTLTENEFFQTIDINANSARYKANYYFELSRFVDGKIAESTFKKSAEGFLKAAGENNPNSMVSNAATVVGVLDTLVPTMQTKVSDNCIHASDLFTGLQTSIGGSIYPKWEVKLVVKRYKTNTGSYIDVPIGYQTTGYYTPSGAKVTN